MGIPRADFGAQWEWHVRRSATRAGDGVTFMVHEAMRCDVDAQVDAHAAPARALGRATGELVTTFMRRHRLRWWTGEQLEAAAARKRRGAACAPLGTDDEFIVVADAP